MNRYLDLKLHPYAVLKHGERIAFFTNLLCAAQVATWRSAEGVENLTTGQSWLRHACLDIAGATHVIRTAA